VGSWALISFQATFYTRVYELTPDVYAPALATILPIGGIVGGVGGGLLADWLSKIGGRAWLTAGARGLLAPPRALRGSSPGSWSTGFAAGKGAWLAANVDALAPPQKAGHVRLQPAASSSALWGFETPWCRLFRRPQPLKVDGHDCLAAGAGSPCAACARQARRSPPRRRWWLTCLRRSTSSRWPPSWWFAPCTPARARARRAALPRGRLRAGVSTGRRPRERAFSG